MTHNEKQEKVFLFLCSKMDKIGDVWTPQERTKYINESVIYVKNTLHLSKQEAMKVVVKFVYKFGLKINNNKKQ